MNVISSLIKSQGLIICKKGRHNDTLCSEYQFKYKNMKTGTNMRCRELQLSV